MKASIMLGDSVAQHPDGTFSMLRAGIDRVWVPKGRPCSFSGGLGVRFTATPSELGKHVFTVKCFNEDGVPVGLEINGGFEFKEIGGLSISFALRLVFPTHGHYTFAVTVDGREVDTYALWVIEGNPPGAPKQEVLP